MHSIESIERIPLLELPLPGFVPRRYRPGNLGTWSGHLAFANDLIAAIQPSLIVELGTHYGESYFGFCQSVVENGLDCLCYAVDHWLGEAHAGQYGEEVMEDVQRYNDTYYKGFSYLLRASFDDAVSQFADESIDLLHIDGLHTYESVNHDFRTWLPKVKPGGIILLHDIAVRHADFGVWRVWEELKIEFPQTFSFHHWWGLGVLRKSRNDNRHSGLLGLLFNNSISRQEGIRRHYLMYASYLENMLCSVEKVTNSAVDTLGEKAETNISARNAVTQVQVFPFGPDRYYSEGASAIQSIELEQWHTVIFDFSDGIGSGPLRIDPADCPCVIELGKISLTSQPSGNVLWNAADMTGLQSLVCSGSSVILPNDDKYLIFSHGIDPQLILPFIEHDGAVRVTISLRVTAALDAVSEALNTNQIRTTADLEIAGLRAELKNTQAERMLAAAELSQVIAERNEARRELRRVEQVVETSRIHIAKEASARELERATRIAMEQSRSWRITRPMRILMRVFKAKD